MPISPGQTSLVFFAIMFCLACRSIGKLKCFGALMHILCILQFCYSISLWKLNFLSIEAELIAGCVMLDFVFLTERNSSNESMQSPQCGDLLYIFCGEG